MNGRTKVIVRSGVNPIGKWEMELNYYLTQGVNEARIWGDPMINLIRFVLEEVYPYQVELREADKIWLKIQHMPMW